MKVEEVRKYIGKKVLIILNNNFKVTCVIPNFEGNSFEAKDKYYHLVTVKCDFISFINEVEEWNVVNVD